jgi:hypothetical protein
MEMIRLITLSLDLIGLFLISWFLFVVPKKTEFFVDSPYGIITDITPIADAINRVSRDFATINKMRFGFAILIISQGFKFYEFFKIK